MCRDIVGGMEGGDVGCPDDVGVVGEMLANGVCWVSAYERSCGKSIRPSE